MKIGMIGLGKLGYPVIKAIQSKGHEIIGCDLAREDEDWITGIPDVVKFADIVFIAVQTPHKPQFEGSTRLPNDRADFDYSYLCAAVSNVAYAAKEQKKHTELAIISTVLPGTINREIKPLLNGYVNLTYNPAFIAMGSVEHDYLNPEFVLLGGDNTEVLERFYVSITGAPILATDIVTAESIKVSYNTFVTMKIVLANLWGEIAQKTGANFDDIFEAWSLSTNRLISDKYLRAGMGDGGGCHPRDNIALSWLARKLNLSHDLFSDLMMAREQHTNWLAKQVPDGAVIFGKSFKPGIDIVTGSPAILLANILREQNKTFIHDEDPEPGMFNFIATQHERYKKIQWPKGATVIDPFRYLQDQEGVNIIRIGG